MNGKKNKADWVPRLSIQISVDQFNALGTLVPHGFRKIVFSKLVDQLIDIARIGGTGALAAIVDGKLGIGFTLIGEIDLNGRSK